MKDFTVKDIRNLRAFPDLDYRFATLDETDDGVDLKRDFIGENPLHYYIDRSAAELIVASNISDIKEYLESQNRRFEWAIGRAVPNNTRVRIDDEAFSSRSPREKKLGPSLQDYAYPVQLDYSDLRQVGKAVRRHLDASIDARLATIREPEVGLLLSGGLDSGSVGILLSRRSEKRITAFTMKVSDDEGDVIRSRRLAQHLGIDLVEVRVSAFDDRLSTSLQRFDPARKLLHQKGIEDGVSIEDVVGQSLLLTAIPVRENVLCAAAMHLMAGAILAEGIASVFCGEGPNEMFNDYGFNPAKLGWNTSDRAHVPFRESQTFGSRLLKEQLGTNGLAGFAVPRMGKMFAHHGIRLEAPYFDRDVARLLTQVPHTSSYDTIKQHFMAAMLSGEGIDHYIIGTTKSMFQDGAGVSRFFEAYSRKRLRRLLREIYGMPEVNFLRKLSRRTFWGRGSR